MERLIGELPVPIVLDHIARIAEDQQLQSAVERCVGRMLDGGRAWLKLSAPYFSARDATARDRLFASISMLMDCYSERLLWGSDWPHATEIDKPDDAQLMDFLFAGASSTRIRRVLVENPTSVYGFSD